MIIFWSLSLVLATAFLVNSRQDQIKIVFCDVGQGDATLISDGKNQILIDAGRNDAVISCLDRHLPFWDRTIEQVIVTHSDSDHIGGFEMVLNRYFVKEILVSEYGSKTDVFRRFRDAVLREKIEGLNVILAKSNITQIIANNIQLYSFVTRVEGFENNPYNSEITETMLWDKIVAQNQAMKEQKLSTNALSIVSFIQIGKTKILLTGDLEAAGERALIERGLIADVDILKVGHHGSKTSTSDELLLVARPEIAVISVGNNNSYGLPSPQVLDKIESFNIQSLRTDEMGDIVFVTNGEDLSRSY